MFSRAAKSIVKSLSRQNHIDEKNFKIALIGVEEINKILLKLLKNNAKQNALSLYDMAAVNKPLPNCNGAYNSFDNQPIKRTDQVEKLVDVLYHLPIAENVSALKNSPEKIIPKACSRMRPYARISTEMDHNNRFLDLMYPLFHKNDVNVILQTKIPKKMYRSIERKKINNSFEYLSIAKENNQVSPKSLSNYDGELERSMRKFRSIPNIEMREKAEKLIDDWMVLLNNKSKLLYEIYHFKFSTFSLNFMIRRSKNNHEVTFASNNNIKMTTSDKLNIIEEENWIQQISFKIKSAFIDAHVKIRSYLSAILNPYSLENILAADGKTQIPDIIFINKVLFASKDCESKFDIRKKIQEYCAQQKKKSLRKKIGKDDICKKRERSCVTSERKCQRGEKMYGKKEIDCTKRGKRTFKEQNVVTCEKRKSSCDKNVRDCHKTRKAESQADRSKQKKNDDTSRTKKDLCKRQDIVEQEQISYKQEQDLCKKEKKEKKEEEEKKEEIKKSDCSEIKQVKPCEKKDCPIVKKAPGCSENDKK